MNAVMRKLADAIGAVGAVVALLAATVALLLVSPFVFMVCWNYVAPVIWKAAPDLTFLQSLAVVIAARILFKPNVTVKKTE